LAEADLGLFGRVGNPKVVADFHIGDRRWYGNYRPPATPANQRLPNLSLVFPQFSLKDGILRLDITLNLKQLL
jgi:hypothetical protein